MTERASGTTTCCRAPTSTCSSTSECCQPIKGDPQRCIQTPDGCVRGCELRSNPIAALSQVPPSPTRPSVQSADHGQRHVSLIVGVRCTWGSRPRSRRCARRTPTTPPRASACCSAVAPTAPRALASAGPAPPRRHARPRHAHARDARRRSRQQPRAAARPRRKVVRLSGSAGRDARGDKGETPAAPDDAAAPAPGPGQLGRRRLRAAHGF